MAINKVQTPPITDPNKPGKSGLWSVWQNDLKNLFAAPTTQIIGVNDDVTEFFIVGGDTSDNIIQDMQGLWAQPSVIPDNPATNGIWLPANPFPQNGWGQLLYSICGNYATGGVSSSTEVDLTWKWFIDISDITSPFVTMTFKGTTGASYNFWVNIIVTFLNNNADVSASAPWTVTYGGGMIIGSSVQAFPANSAFAGSFTETTQLGITMATTSASSTSDKVSFSLIQISKV